ncbi:DUF2147 domain-containing protein [Exilibacterium tricleocarpae]|nr:DUF2147 domain-containing protein [Exilibacterium tricleocarpae]
MLKYISIAVVLCVALVSVANAEPQGLLGLWRTQEENGVVEMFRCGEAVCGRVIDAASLRENPDQRDVHNGDEALRERRVKGLVILQDFTGGPRKWTGGPLYDPKTGDGAKSGSLTLKDGNTLKVKGCLVAFLCRTQVWRRIE